MDIEPNQIARKTKVGMIGDRPVVEVVTKGGWHMVMSQKNGKLMTMGVGSHRAVARHIAGQKEKIDWCDLAKADYIAPEHYAVHLPLYTYITEKVCAREGQ